MTSHSDFDAVIFDMDGLLLDTERIFRDAFADTVAEMGFVLPDGLHRRMVGLPGGDCDALLGDHFGPTFSLLDFRERLIISVDDRLGGGVPLRPGVLDLLDFLEARDIPKAIATSSGRKTADRHLGRSDLHHRFPVIATRDDVARGKPYPDVYLKAAVGLGVAPERCVALEDSHNGIRAAHAAAIPVIMVPDQLEATEEIAAFCLAVLDDLHHVRRFFGGA